MAKKATFRSVPAVATEPTAGEVDSVDEVDTAPATPAPQATEGEEFTAESSSGGSTNAVPHSSDEGDDAEEVALADLAHEDLLGVALGLQDDNAELIAKIADLEGALAEAVIPAPQTILEGEISGASAMGIGAIEIVPVYLKRMWARSIPGVGVGDCIAVVTLRDTVDLNLLVDAVRNGYASDTPPVS